MLPRVATDQPELKRMVQALLDALPPLALKKPRCEPDFYGASNLIATQAGLSEPPESLASWLHGWRFNTLVHPSQLATDQWWRFKERNISEEAMLEASKARVNLVANEEQARFLHQHGYELACAAGLPIVYAQANAVDRVPGSLLVLPVHSMSYLHLGRDQERYVDEIVRIKDDFSLVVACVHSACIEKNDWIPHLENAGIPWICGAHLEDRNALTRMRTFFSAFEFVTTNTVGSALAYAALCGCRPSVFGPFPAITMEDFREDPFYKKHPQILEVMVNEQREEALRDRFAPFFVAPRQAPEATDWGREQCGAGFRRPPVEMARLLGWAWSKDDDVLGSLNGPEIAARLGWKLPKQVIAAPFDAHAERLEQRHRAAWEEQYRLKREERSGRKSAEKDLRRTRDRLAKCQGAYGDIRRSLAWKLARPFYSLERRLRRRFTTKDDPG